MKKIIVFAILLLATPAFADYTLDLKNEGGTVIKTYTITTNQVTHLQKVADRDGISVLTLFEDSLRSLVVGATLTNMRVWRRANEAYVEEQSRLP